MTEYSLLACPSRICFLLPSRTTCLRAVSPGELDLSISCKWESATDFLLELRDSSCAYCPSVGIWKPVKGRFPSRGLARGSVVFPADSEPQRWGCVKSEVACTSWCYLQAVWFTSSLGFHNNISIWNVQHWILKHRVSGSSCSGQYYSPWAALLKNKSSLLSFLPSPSPLFSWEGTCNSRFFLVGLPDRVRPQVCSLSIYGRKWEIRPAYVVCEFPSVEY